MVRSENTDGCRVANGVRKTISDLRASGAEVTGREDRFERGNLVSCGLRSGVIGVGGSY